MLVLEQQKSYKLMKSATFRSIYLHRKNLLIIKSIFKESPKKKKINIQRTNNLTFTSFLEIFCVFMDGNIFRNDDGSHCLALQSFTRDTFNFSRMTLLFIMLRNVILLRMRFRSTAYSALDPFR